MNGKVLKTAALIFVILLTIFSLSACDRVKASIGFKWGQLPMSNHYCEFKNTQKKSGPAADIKQNITIETGSGTAISGYFEGPA
jgi:hypothetical protein